MPERSSAHVFRNTWMNFNMAACNAMRAWVKKSKSWKKKKFKRHHFVNKHTHSNAKRQRFSSTFCLRDLQRKVPIWCVCTILMLIIAIYTNTDDTRIINVPFVVVFFFFSLQTESKYLVFCVRIQMKSIVLFFIFFSFALPENVLKFETVSWRAPHLLPHFFFLFKSQIIFFFHLFYSLYSVLFLCFRWIFYFYITIKYEYIFGSCCCCHINITNN